MQELNPPRHAIDALEKKKWARKLQQQIVTWWATRSPARIRTDFGVSVERRPRLTACVGSGS
jgi:hypothetical protein